MNINFFWLLSIVLVQVNFINANEVFESDSPKESSKNKQFIDVVIPTTFKDIETLELCIEGIKSNCDQIRRIIVISPYKFTENAEWYDERNFPFSKEDIALCLNKENKFSTQKYLQNCKQVSWYYQQLLKLYAPFVIPDISNDVLILDSDTIFLNPVTFIDETGNVFYNVSPENYLPYFIHAKKLIPNFIKKSKYSGITHHMLFQKSYLNDLFDQVEKYHQEEFWKAFCYCVDDSKIDRSGASEYEIYFNYILLKNPFAKIRKLKYVNVSNLKLEKFKAKGFDYVSCHSDLRYPQKIESKFNELISEKNK